MNNNKNPLRARILLGISIVLSSISNLWKDDLPHFLNLLLPSITIVLASIVIAIYVKKKISKQP